MTKKIIKKIIKYVLISFFVACLAVVAIQRLTGRIPTLFNHSVFIILTDSMTPELSPGDVILVEHVDPSEIKNGDYVTYNGASGDYAGKVITHKVVQEPNFVNGKFYYQTQGIKSGAPLDPEISEDELIGRCVTKLTVVTFFYKIFSNTFGFIFLIVVPLIGMLIMQFIQLINDNKAEEEKKIEDQKKKDLKDKSNKYNIDDKYSDEIKEYIIKRLEENKGKEEVEHAEIKDENKN